MSTTATETAARRVVRIPSLLTNSLRVILEAYGEDIIHLHAHGAVETRNSTPVEDLQRYGLSREQQTHHRLRLEYEQFRNADGGAANPLTEETIEELLAEVERVLDKADTAAEPDLAVTSCTIRVTEPTLQEVTPAQTSEFDLTFVADPAEAPVRDHTRRLNADRRLYSDLGFNVTNLNLRSLVETATKHHQQSDGRYLSWGGPEDVRPRAPTKLALRVNEQILPDPYGTAKPYVVVEDHEIQVPEDAAEEAIDATGYLRDRHNGGDV